MRRLIVAVSLVGVMGLGGLGWGHAAVARAATAPNVTCILGPPLPAGTYNNVTVPTGERCYLNSNVIILGNVTAQARSALTVNGTTIHGNLQDSHGGTLSVTFATIGGNLQVGQMTSSVEVYNTHVTGDGQFTNNTGFDLVVSFSSFGGNLQVNNNILGINQLDSNFIGNNLDCENNDVPPNSIGTTIVQGHSYGQCAQ